MKTLRKLLIYLSAFWYGWMLVYRIKRSKVPVIDYLDRLTMRRSGKSGLAAEEICNIVARASARFWFHRRQPCLAQSLTAYYYLKRYGYKPHLIMEIDFNSEQYHNCHCRVSLSRDIHEYPLKGFAVLNTYKHFILLERNTEQEGGSDGECSSDRLLQSELPLLFCKKNDGREKGQYQHHKFQNGRRLFKKER